jgi:hypothetical protein
VSEMNVMILLWSSGGVNFFNVAGGVLGAEAKGWNICYFLYFTISNYTLKDG